mgnify:CR=1 FL=1
MAVLYLDASAVLRALLEKGTSPEVEARIEAAESLVTSRLSLVESARALARLRTQPKVKDSAISRVELALDELWNRCAIWELSPAICDHAARLAPRSTLRTLDALHLATYLAVRRSFDEVELLTTDERLANAAGEQ